jgi:AraC-like DNA-binding protein
LRAGDRQTPVSSQARETHQVSARLLVPVVRLLRELGVEPAALLADAGVPAAALADPDVRVTADGLRDVLTLATERTGAPTFALRAGQCLRPGDLGLLEYLVRTSSSLAEIGDKLGRYHRLAGDLPPEIEADEHRVVCRLPPAGPEGHVPIVEEYNLSFWAKLARMIQDESLRPIEVQLTGPVPSYADEAAALFGAPVRFASPKNGLVFDRRTIAAVVIPVDEGLRRAVGESAAQALAALGPDPITTDRVRTQIQLQLRGEGVGAESVARALGMSPRTLRRRLEAEETTFQAQRDAVRRELALEHMRESQLAISEIAYLLGFAETTAFHRAFRRWTGKTPNQYRSEAMGEG